MQEMENNNLMKDSLLTSLLLYGKESKYEAILKNLKR